MATKKQLDEFFVTGIAKTINHTKEFQGRYWYKNLEHPALFGEFLTHLRREMTILAISPELKTFCINICKKDAWATVGKPKYEFDSYRRRNNSCWTCTYIVDDGVWYMDYERATQLCKQAELQAKYQTQNQESSVEITIQLSRLEQQLKEMNATISVVENLNNEADKVVVNLCKVAESLVA